MRQFLIGFCILMINVSIAQAMIPSLTLSTTSFLDQGALPVLYTCDGKNVPPQLSWSDVPPKTQSFVLTLLNPDEPNGSFYHWILYDIKASVREFPEAMKNPPAGVKVGKNSWGKTEYSGPCPPLGTAHHYIFTLYAIDKRIELPDHADAKTILSALKNHTLAKGELTVVYSRWLMKH